MKFGLEESTIEKITKIFEDNSKVDKAYIFGSRAKGNYREGSDIDISIKGYDIQHDDILEMMAAFDDAEIAQKIDLLNYDAINEPALKEHIDRVGIEFYSRWKQLKLADLILTANTGLDAIKRAPIVVTNTGVRCLRIQDISQNKPFEKWGFTEVEEKNYKKFQLKKNDIIIARTGETIGVNKIIKNDLPSVFNNGLIRIKSNPQLLDAVYLSYIFKSNYFVNYIESISGGTSTQPNMQINALLDMKIPLPLIAEQAEIASVLLDLDNKIDLLQRQNKTLEEMAEVLFRQRFVEEAEEVWEVGTLEDEFDFTMGQSPEGSDLNEDGEGVVFFQGRTDFGFRFPIPRVYTTASTRLAKKSDTLVSVRAPVGDMNMAFEDCCLGRGVAAFRYKFNQEYYSYTYYKLRSLMQQIKQFEDNGSIFGSIGKDDFKKMENTIPPNALIENFQRITKPVDDKIYANTEQIYKLIKLRDTLLPKLMSGQVRVRMRN